MGTNERRTLTVLHLHTGSDGQSHFSERDLKLTPGRHGSTFELLSAVQGIAIREVEPGWSLGYHNAPRRQIVLQLSGKGELICGDGASRIVGPGDILLADDVTGQGHISREVAGPRSQLVIYLHPALNLSSMLSDG